MIHGKGIKRRKDAFFKLNITRESQVSGAKRRLENKSKSGQLYCTGKCADFLKGSCFFQNL